MDLDIIHTRTELPEALCSNPPLPHILNLPSEILGIILNNVLAVPFAKRPPWGSWVELTNASIPDVEFSGVNPNYTLSGSRTHITPKEWLQPLLTCSSFYFIGRAAFYAINPIIFRQGGTVAQLYNVSPERCGFLRSLNLEPGDSDPAVVFNALSKYHHLQHLRISFHEDNEQDQEWLQNCAEPPAQFALQQLPDQLRELELLVLRNNDYSSWMFPRQLDEAGWSDDLIEIAEDMTMAVTGRSMLYHGLTIVHWPLIEPQESEDSDDEKGEAFIEAQESEDSDDEKGGALIETQESMDSDVGNGEALIEPQESEDSDVENGEVLVEPQESEDSDDENGEA
ncbi:MAG: hypothetical protein LQ342_004267 [Letrouitia transgressa]|nr:MAG: hypothetical protein LQ342_004267 [Letrouitia transgressa]